jgi:hypothetical protein
MKYRKLKGYKYELMRSVDHRLCFNIPDLELSYISTRPDTSLLIIKARYAWDGASGPAIDTKNFMRGSLVHDVLYQLIREGHLDKGYRKLADQELRRICLEDGMSKIRAWWVYSAVRTFAKRSSMPRKNPRGKVVTL